MLWIWKQKWFWKYYFIIIVSGTILGGIVGYLANHDFFEQFKAKSIGEKYVYFYNVHWDKKYRDPLLSKEIKSAREVELYYYQELNLKPIEPPFSIYGWDERTYIPMFLKVDILKYIGDSSIVKIRAKYTGTFRPVYVEEVGYLPSIVLHDTLPKDYEKYREGEFNP